MLCVEIHEDRGGLELLQLGFRIRHWVVVLDGENFEWPDVYGESKWTATVWNEKRCACPFQLRVGISQPMGHEVVHEFLQEVLLVLKVFPQSRLDGLGVCSETDSQWQDPSSWTGRE